MDKTAFTQAIRKQQRTRTLRKARTKLTAALNQLNACTLLLNEAERNLHNIDRRDVPLTDAHDAIQQTLTAVQTCLRHLPE